VRNHYLVVPRYFFDLTNGEGTTVDAEGAVLADLAAARDYAIRAARDVAGADIRDGREVSLGSFVAIRDEAGCEVGRATFAEALRITC